MQLGLWELTDTQHPQPTPVAVQLLCHKKFEKTNRVMIKGNAAILANKVPSFSAPAIDGQQ